jgi:hypothetical protein
MTRPRRIQLSRKKGWRMPDNTLSVARPGKWGNPFKIGISVSSGTRLDFVSKSIRTRADAVEAFQNMLAFPERHYPSADEIATMRGKNLACWCPLGEPCHADVLLDLANA